MIKMYNTNMTTNITTEVNEYKRGNWINMINPTESEIFEVCRNLNIEQEFIKYSLDYEEKARIDLEEDDGTILFIIDVPIIERENDVEIYTTMPVGVIFVRDEYVITVSLKENDIIKKMERIVGKKVITYKKSQFLFQLFYENSSAFLNLLKEINKKTEHIERTLKKDLKNEDLLKMLNLEKALVYITTSLKSDEVVMEKTLRGKIIKLYEEDEDLLEDAIVENKQAIEMSKIYSDILNETMDMYASIISNNINDIMKFLTSITIILAIPTLVASLWGTNVPVPFQNYQYGFPVLLAVSFVVTLTVMIWLKKRNMLN